MNGTITRGTFTDQPALDPYRKALRESGQLTPLVPLETLVVAPDLPTWLSEVVLHDLRVGAATATIALAE